MHKSDTLYCYSWYNKGYSALYSKMKSGQTIEYLYQYAKRDKDGKKVGKGNLPAFIRVNGVDYPHTNSLRHVHYWMLWYIHLLENPEKWGEILSHRYFTEKGEERGDRVFDSVFDSVNADKSLFEEMFSSASTNQAHILCLLKVQRQGGMTCSQVEAALPDCIQQAINRYWDKYHPGEKRAW